MHSNGAQPPPLTIGSLCSGYGGLDLAAEYVLAAETRWHCELAAAPARILAERWPGVPNHRDLTKVDWTQVEPVDIITAGYPCQPFSAAGRRKGTNDERHLWPYVREAIRQLRPGLAILENVAGHRSLGFDRVLGDLAEDGLDAEWVSLRAADVGAPHGRERLFFIAYRDSAANDGGRPSIEGRRQERRGAARGDRPVIADACGERCDGRRRAARYPRGPHAATYRLDHSAARWGDYGPAIERWANVAGPPPPPTEARPCQTHPRLNVRFAEWMMGLTAGWVTDVGIPVDDGDQLSMFEDIKPPPREMARIHQLKMLGNGVVPQQAEAAIIELIGRVCHHQTVDIATARW